MGFKPKNDRIEFLLLKGRGLFMAKSLSSLKQRDDYQGRQIRCLIVENHEGTYERIKESDRFKQIINETPASLLTMVYEPTEADRQHLVRLIGGNLQTVEDETVADISEEDVLLTLLTLTDLEFDATDLQTNQALMREILEKPSKLFLTLKNELNLILIETVKELEDVLDFYRQMPAEMLDATNAMLSLQQEMEDNEEKIKTEKQQIEALKARIKELEAMEHANL